MSSSYLIRAVTIRLSLQLVHASLVQAWIPFSGDGREVGGNGVEDLSSIELERGICCTWRGEVGGQRLILIKCARLFVSRNPVCHARCVEESLWHSLTYGLACCFAQHMLFTVGLVPRALFSWGAGLLLLFIWPSAPQTGLLIFRPVWATQSNGIIQKDGGRESREGGGKRMKSDT